MIHVFDGNRTMKYSCVRDECEYYYEVTYDRARLANIFKKLKEFKYTKYYNGQLAGDITRFPATINNLYNRIVARTNKKVYKNSIVHHTENNMDYVTYVYSKEEIPTWIDIAYSSDLIIEQVDEFDGFVSGVGTGGTLIGVGSVLKQKKNTKVIVIDPKESGLIAFGQSKGKHKIQGLSDQVIPALYNKDLIDEYIEIASDDAICMARKIRQIFGISVGISSGANLLGAVLSEEKVIVTVLPDDDKKYLSTDLYNESITSKLVDDINFISAK